MKRKYIWIMLVLWLGLLGLGTVGAQDQSPSNGHAKVVYLLPDAGLISKIPKSKFDVYFVMTQEDYESDKGYYKGVPLARICFVIKKDNLDEMRNCLKKFMAKLKGEKFKYLVNGASEDEVMFAGHLRSEFDVENGMKKEEAEIFVDKYKMKVRLMANAPSIPTAKFLNIKGGGPTTKELSQIKNLDLPMIFKPTNLASSQGIMIVRTPEDLEKAVKVVKGQSKTFDYIVEEYIEGPVMRIDGFVVNGNVKVAYPSVYDPSCYMFYRHGAPQVTYSDFNVSRKSEYDQFTQSVITALGLKDGPYHLEAIRSKKNNKLYFLEIGARPGGDSEFLERFYHYPFDNIHVQSQVGIKPRPHLVPHTPENGFAIVDCPTLPPSSGKRQKLNTFTHMGLSKFKTLCHDETEKAEEGDVFEVDDTVSTFASFFFKGPERRAREEGEKLRDSVSGEFTVWDSESMTPPKDKKRKRDVAWPLPSAKGI